MPSSRQQNRGPSGILSWLIVLGVVLYGLVAIITWPFRRAVRLIPGRREKMLRVFSAELSNAIPGATKFVQELGAGVPGLEATMTQEMRRLQEALDIAASERKWPEDLELENPWESAIDVLERAKCIGAIDHNSDVNELRKSLNPLLKRQGVKFDWTFLKELEESCDSNALKNENLLPRIGSRLNSLGYVLVHIDSGDDNFYFCVCAPELFSRVEPLANGGCAIRRFSLAPPAA
jgi:hypothetical protein